MMEKAEIYSLNFCRDGDCYYGEIVYCLCCFQGMPTVEQLMQAGLSEADANTVLLNYESELDTNAGNEWWYLHKETMFLNQQQDEPQ